MKKNLKLILKAILNLTRRAYFSLLDIYELLLGRRGKLIPPKRKGFVVGNGDFKKVGNEFFEYFVKLGGLKKNESVLDVGCGIGRMALPLTKYLSANGHYEGFDIVKTSISWCNRNITPQYPNFQFQLANIFNESYHPKGRYKASEYNFPYSDKSFDFVFLTSVFTHMLPGDMENYFSEISRVLKKDGRCLITFFLLNAESLSCIEKKQSKWDLKYNYGKYRIEDNEMPERVISYNENFVRELYEKYKLSIDNPIHYGSWCGRKNYLNLQDIVIAVRN